MLQRYRPVRRELLLHSVVRAQAVPHLVPPCRHHLCDRHLLHLHQRHHPIYVQHDGEPGRKPAKFLPLWVTCWDSVCACPLVTSRRTWCLQKAGDTWSEAYSRILGTLLVCAWLTVALSFMPPKLLRRIFPPLVTGWVLDPTVS